MEIGARPIVNGVRVILVIVLVDGNEAGELVGSLLIRIRLGVLLGVAVIGFPNGGTFREMSVDEIFETVADGGVCAAGVLVEVEVDAFGQFTVVVCNLQLRHDALIGVDLKLIVVGHAARDLRNDDGDETGAGGAKQTGYRQHIASTVGVVGHAGSESPIRHIADGVHHAPDEVHDGHRRKAAVRVGIPGQEAQYRDARHGKSHPSEIGTALAPLGLRPVDDGAHDGVVECVIDTRQQHEQSDRQCAVAYRVRHEDGQIRPDDGADEVLPETAEGISDTLFGLHIAIVGISPEQLVPE